MKCKQGEPYELTHEWCEAKIAECAKLREALKIVQFEDEQMDHLTSYSRDVVDNALEGKPLNSQRRF